MTEIRNPLKLFLGDDTGIQPGESDYLKRPGAAIPGPTAIIGGGSMVQFPDGRIVGPFGGECLRQSLERGAKVVGDPVPPTITQLPNVEQQQHAVEQAYAREEALAGSAGRA